LLSIEQITYRIWKVIDEDEEDRNEYYVRLSEKGWICSCCGVRRLKDCIHILFTKEFLVDNIKRGILDG